MADTPATKEQLERAISDLEAQRSLLGDFVVDPAISALREQLARLHSTRLETGDDDERKVVTVMFADLSGFTRLAEQMEAEEARNLVNSCFERFVPVIQRYGGTIDKFLGDAIMILFGAPVAHENDPERALRTSLELVAALETFNGERGLSLGLHVGINTGAVIAGAVGARGRQDYSVMGDTVNVAARLEDACGENEILVGPETFRRGATLFEFEALPPLELKGKSEPLPVYRLLESKVEPKTAELISKRTPFFGRERELQKIKSAIAQLKTGNGTLLCISGEAGLGKSRLVLETRGLSRFAGWAETRALSYAETTGYRMMRDLLHALLATTPGGDPHKINSTFHENILELAPDRVERIYPYLARILEAPLQQPWVERLEHLSAEVLQTRILEAFRGYVEARAQREKLVLVWEDVHWADPSSLQALEHLAPIVVNAPVLVVVAYRRESNVWERLNRLAAQLPKKCVQVIELAALTARESADLIAAAGEIDDSQTRQAILNRAEGNPFFLEELVRAVRDARVMTIHDISDIPPTLQAVIAARIDSLPAAAKRVLQRASVIGRTFQIGILAHLCKKQGEHALPETIEELCRRNLVYLEQIAGSRATFDQTYTFQHAITHEVAYQSLLQVTRREWHRHVGEAVETLLPDRLAELSGVLGRHFELAGVPDKAITYFIRAADRARETFSNLEAIGFYRSALAQAESQAGASFDALMATLREGLGDVLILNGEFAPARDQFEQAEKLVAESDRIARSRLELKIGLSWIHRRDFEKALEGLHRAELELESDLPTRGTGWWNAWAQIQHERMHLFYWLGQCDELNTLAEQVEPNVEKHGTIMQRAKFFMMRALSLLSEYHYSPPPTAVEYAERAVELAKERDNPAERVHLKFTLGFVRLWHGDLEESVAALNEALELAERIGDVVLQVRSLIYLAVAHRGMNSKSAAQEFAKRAMLLAAKLDMVHYIAMANATLAWVAWKDGDHSKSRTLATQALEDWHSMPDPYGFDWMALWPLIAVAHAEGNFAVAIEWMKALFGPNQHPLPARLTAAVRETIRAAGENPAHSAKLASEALRAARDAHQI